MWRPKFSYENNIDDCLEWCNKSFRAHPELVHRLKIETARIFDDSVAKRKDRREKINEKAAQLNFRKSYKQLSVDEKGLIMNSRDTVHAQKTLNDVYQLFDLIEHQLMPDQQVVDEKEEVTIKLSQDGDVHMTTTS